MIKDTGELVTFGFQIKVQVTFSVIIFHKRFGIYLCRESFFLFLKFGFNWSLIFY